MAKIEIEWLEDSHDCDTCGYNYAIGANVKIDGVLVLELEPAAACFGGDSYDEKDVYRKILEHLGYEIEGDL